MIQDLSQSFEKASFRTQGLQAKGKLLRGFTQDAPLKATISSIPGKYETIIYKQQPVKAFGTQSNRFYDPNKKKMDETPGPGSYDDKRADILTNGEQSTMMSSTMTASFSKKGYLNGFVSKSERKTFNIRYLNTGPGPGSYNSEMNSSFYQNLINEKQKEQNQNYVFKSKGRNDQILHFKQQSMLPGPGDYNPKKTKNHVNPCISSFISQTNREQYMKVIPNTPSPCNYEVMGDINKKLPFKHNGGTSTFCNPVPKIKEQQHNPKELLKFLDEDKIQKDQETTPGPGYYKNKIEIEESVEKQDLKATYQFQQGQKDRFGDFVDESKRKIDQIGPGYYEQQDYTIQNKVGDKELVVGSVFMSESRRKPFNDFEKRLGPNLTIPYIQSKKKSYHLNLARKFI